MTREKDNEMSGQEEGSAEAEEGMAHRVVGKMRRVVGALGRAARGAAGAPEAGTDILFQKLHSEHEEVNILFEKLRELEEGSRAETLWRELSFKLLLHARAEQQTVYEPLSRWDETRESVAHGFQEHSQIEMLLMQSNELVPGTQGFRTALIELEQTVRQHVDDEEGDLLPRAREALSDPQLEQLVARFEERKMELTPMIEDELSRAPQQKEREEEPKAPQQQKEREAELSKAPQKKERKTEAQPRESRRPRRPAKAAAGKQDKIERSELEERTFDELMEIARKREIPGRSKMKKKDLVEALENPMTDPG